MILVFSMLCFQVSFFTLLIHPHQEALQFLFTFCHQSGIICISFFLLLPQCVFVTYYLKLTIFSCVFSSCVSHILEKTVSFLQADTSSCTFDGLKEQGLKGAPLPGTFPFRSTVSKAGTPTPGGPTSKESACNVEDPGSIPELGRSPGEGNDNTLQYSCLENPMDRRAWQATVRGITKSQTPPPLGPSSLMLHQRLPPDGALFPFVFLGVMPYYLCPLPIPSVGILVVEREFKIN